MASATLTAADPTPEPLHDVDFGVVIPVAPEHLHWARGTCASIRSFMGDRPTCLLLDGEADTKTLEETYDASTLSRSEIEQGPIACNDLWR